MSLLNTKTGYTTPWHCSVALMATGEWISATMIEFKKDPALEIVAEDGRPSYFHEKTDQSTNTSDGEESASHQKASKYLDKRSTSSTFHTEAAVAKSIETVKENLPHQTPTPVSSCLDNNEEEKVAESARMMSHYGIKNDKGEFVNPFFGSEHPLLDPNSGKFNSKAWLKTLMGITSRDPERYPKRVAGVAYKNLSAYGFGEPTDYQKTFGNYPFKLLSLAKRLFGKWQKTKIHILRHFDGLVKNGEMLLILGRPGRQVML